MLITGIWNRHIRLPVRVSSLPRRAILPPLTYTIVEDVIAVDGGGGLEFRQAWRHRYEASRVIRKIIRTTAIGWGLSGTVLAAGLIVAAWTAPTDTGYGLSYGLPWLWAMLSAVGTILYVKSELERERREWFMEKVHKEVSLNLKEHDVDREADMRVLATWQSRPSEGGARPAGRHSGAENRV